MAAVAGNVFVFALQGEIRFPVIKIECLPGFGVMAVVTLFSEFALVRVLFAVAVDARSRGFRILFLRQMTATTWDLNMRALEGKIGFVVVESRAIKQHDTGISADVLCVARLAVAFPNAGSESMVSAACAHVGIDVFVTISAQFGLCAFLETNMAQGTFAFVLGVSAYDLTGHEQRLDISGTCRIHKQETHGGKQVYSDVHPLNHVLRVSTVSTYALR
jgi:hypothetical protein